MAFFFTARTQEVKSLVQRNSFSFAFNCNSLRQLGIGRFSLRSTLVVFWIGTQCRTTGVANDRLQLRTYQESPFCEVFQTRPCCRAMSSRFWGAAAVFSLQLAHQRSKQKNVLFWTTSSQSSPDRATNATSISILLAHCHKLIEPKSSILCFEKQI